MHTVYAFILDVLKSLADSGFLHCLQYIVYVRKTVLRIENQKVCTENHELRTEET